MKIALITLLAAAAAAPAAITIRSDFEGGSIGRVEQVAPAHFRCAVNGEVDQDKRNRQASWYYFQVDGAAGTELTLDLTELAGEYNYRSGHPGHQRRYAAVRQLRPEDMDAAGRFRA